MPPRITATLLTYAGTLPLIAAALGLALRLTEPTQTLAIATAYSAIIISFLAGIHWAYALCFFARCPRNLFLTSNAVALLAWLSVFAGEHPWPLVLHMLCLLYLLTLDRKLRDAGVLPAWFYTLRRKATVIVVAALGLIAATTA